MCHSIRHPSNGHDKIKSTVQTLNPEACGRRAMREFWGVQRTGTGVPPVKDARLHLRSQLPNGRDARSP